MKQSIVNYDLARIMIEIKLAFVIAAFVALIVDSVYFYELYMFNGENTILLASIEIFNVALSFYVYALFVRFCQFDMSDVSDFIKEVQLPSYDECKSEDIPKPYKFVGQWRMYSSPVRFNDDVSKLRLYYSRYSRWSFMSLLTLFLCLFFNCLDVLFSGESARIYMIWKADVAFLMFHVHKFILALIFILCLSLFFYYRYKIRKIVTDTSKCSLVAD